MPVQTVQTPHTGHGSLGARRSRIPIWSLPEMHGDSVPWVKLSAYRQTTVGTSVTSARSLSQGQALRPFRAETGIVRFTTIRFDPSRSGQAGHRNLQSPCRHLPPVSPPIPNFDARVG